MSDNDTKKIRNLPIPYRRDNQKKQRLIPTPYYIYKGRHSKCVYKRRDYNKDTILKVVDKAIY